MPWEKNFDLDEATAQAMCVFWSKGYEATSLSDLTAAMGINKGSLYNAFGSKHALFSRALLKYDLEHRRALLNSLKTRENPIAAITELFDAILAESLSDAEYKGCFVVNTALELPHHEPEVQKVVIGAFAELEEFFRSRLRKAKAEGLLSPGVKVNSEAKALLSQLVGLRILARGALDATALKALSRSATHRLRAADA